MSDEGKELHRDPQEDLTSERPNDTTATTDAGRAKSATLTEGSGHTDTAGSPGSKRAKGTQRAKGTNENNGTDGDGSTEVLARAESREKRTQRISASVLVLVIGLLLLVLTQSTRGQAQFALSDAFDTVQLPTISAPGFITVLISALLCLGAGAVMLTGKLRGTAAGFLAAVAGIAVVVGFLTWGAADRGLPFPVSNQFAGTLAVATPLILGALCGVLCERSGVVNVAIEGQMLTGAFAAAIVGSVAREPLQEMMTPPEGASPEAIAAAQDSATAAAIAIALLAAVLAGVLMAAILAAFALKYLVDQVVLGVVINLLAAGLTGFIFDQLVKPATSEFNSAPIMSPVPIPGLEKIPFFGKILFQQTILAYIAIVSVVLVWFLLRHTKWGLRIRAVGEHPEAADTVGISVNAIRWSAVLVGGVFAGLGGAFFTIGSTGAFSKDLTVGNGFIALAAVIMGRWHPVGAAVIALFFGFVTQMASQLQTLNTPVDSQFLLILPYVATIIAVAGLVGRVRSPAASGTPFVKS